MDTQFAILRSTIVESHPFPCMNPLLGELIASDLGLVGRLDEIESIILSNLKCKSIEKDSK